MVSVVYTYQKELVMVRYIGSLLMLLIILQSIGFFTSEEGLQQLTDEGRVGC